MRIEEITENDANQVIATVSMTMDEATESNALNWHQTCQIVKGVTVADLLDEAAERLEDQDCGQIWIMCAEIARKLREDGITV